ncbi:TIGR01459 family HAD-type hydrolase [Rhodoplanes sp. TEM]|uniref:TIGR01459 family HAD-type hydrolase n=1 Tax=Rhodoplanes tepidamans TaxID=200616 RepID=A0ABT5JIC7_RHOTP|nr:MULTISPECIES: TIGR01459 family HAD-type hydrolase [Rhodoplanes]MDC7789356.1 TIGR01459 family HAD-type hydrolase [Rhodoplanes tepidamans]MDC7987155.1 TIGR01459 family HAD-type hydrolase [Rhodoplanes sp. TEM]MDQ0358485.1 HAD superfamily hydrolase (TIGR01459 family) [Rhodoplanes tepidamans]
MSIPFPTLTDHFAPLASRYDVLFCDVWGVIHNGVAPFPETVDALQRFRAGGGRVVLLTNAPRDGDVVVQFLDTLKVPRDAYDAVVTSGDVARAEIEARRDQAVLHIGPERDYSMFDHLELRFAPVERADYAVCSGLFDDETETPDDYRELMAAMRARDLFMVCANPDRVVERGHELVYCAGAIADLYESMGGAVMFTGKPYRPIYERALARAAALRGAAVPLDRVLAIGDSVRTDLKGAAGFGVDCLFVTAGIHAGELGGHETVDHGALAAIFTEAGLLPAAVTRRLAW